MQLQPAINKRSESLKRKFISFGEQRASQKTQTQGVRVGNHIFVGGQYSLDERGEILGSDITTQARNAFEAVKRVLAEAGATMADVVKHNVYFHCDGDDAEVAKFIDDLNRFASTTFLILALQQLRYGLDSAEKGLSFWWTHGPSLGSKSNGCSHPDIGVGTRNCPSRRAGRSAT